MRIVMLGEIYSEGCEYEENGEKCGERTGTLLLTEEEYEKYRDVLARDIDEAVREIYPDGAGKLLCDSCFKKHVKEIKETFRAIDGSTSIGSFALAIEADQTKQ